MALNVMSTMNSRISLPVWVALFFPDVVCANSMAPIFPVLSVWGWLALPIIVVIEGAFFAGKSVRNPYKLSFYSNLWSALIGIAFAVLTFPIMLGPAIDADFASIIIGAIFTIFGTTFHWWLSSRLEHKFSKMHTLWKNDKIPVSLFYKANGLSYGLIVAIFSIGLIRLVLEYKSRT